MITLERFPKIGKVPDFKGQEYGKIQLTSAELGKYVGCKLRVIIKIDEPFDNNNTVETNFA